MALFKKRPPGTHRYSPKGLSLRFKAWRGDRALKRVQNGLCFERLSSDNVLDPSGITVILSAFKRLHWLPYQLAALRCQSVPPQQIWLWHNVRSEEPLSRDLSTQCDRLVVSNHDWSFFGRFSLALMAQTQYVAVIDDDIFPAPQWFESCIDTIEAGHDGILGGAGVILPPKNYYRDGFRNVGWNGEHHTDVQEVDFVGHSWFMRSQHAHLMWRERPYTWNNAEDMHLSCMAQLHGGLKTWVPPHPEKQPALWSCEVDRGRVASTTHAASKAGGDFKMVRDQAVEHYKQKMGWKILSTRDL